MDLGFSLRGRTGRITVTYERNERPELVGAGQAAFGFPWCHAAVSYPAQGYDAVLGWVQLVRSDDNRSAGVDFEIDPLDFLGDVPHPFCWIGLEPQLFDAPSRSPVADVDWVAHSFLCVPDGGGDEGFEVHALAGFAWGFRARGGVIELDPPAPLTAGDWDEHLALLAGRYPSWRFVRGFRAD